MGHFKNTGAGHSAISLDANSNQDAIIYFSKNGASLCSLRLDRDDDDNHGVDFRDHTAGQNQEVFEIYDEYGWYYVAKLHGHFWPSISDTYSMGSLLSFWDNVRADVFVNMSPAAGNKSSKAFTYGLKEIISIEPQCFLEVGENSTRELLELHPKSLAKIIPSAVEAPEEAEGNWGIKYDQVIPVLIRAIQEQQAQIDELKKQVSALNH